MPSRNGVGLMWRPLIVIVKSTVVRSSIRGAVMLNLINALFRGNYTYVTTPPCSNCGATTELALDDESLARYDEATAGEHVVCPTSVVFIPDLRG